MRVLRSKIFRQIVQRGVVDGNDSVFKSTTSDARLAFRSAPLALRATSSRRGRHDNCVGKLLVSVVFHFITSSIFYYTVGVFKKRSFNGNIESPRNHRDFGSDFVRKAVRESMFGKAPFYGRLCSRIGITFSITIQTDMSEIIPCSLQGGTSQHLQEIPQCRSRNQCSC